MATATVDPILLALAGGIGGVIGSLITGGASFGLTVVNNRFQASQRAADRTAQEKQQATDHAHQLKVDQITADRALRKEERQQLSVMYVAVLQLLYGLSDEVSNFNMPISPPSRGEQGNAVSLRTTLLKFLSQWEVVVTPIRLESLAQPVVEQLKTARATVGNCLARINTWTYEGANPDPEWQTVYSALVMVCVELAQVFRDNLDSIYAPSKEEV